MFCYFASCFCSRVFELVFNLLVSQNLDRELYQDFCQIGHGGTTRMAATWQQYAYLLQRNVECDFKWEEFLTESPEACQEAWGTYGGQCLCHCWWAMSWEICPVLGTTWLQNTMCFRVGLSHKALTGDGRKEINESPGICTALPAFFERGFFKSLSNVEIKNIRPW